MSKIIRLYIDHYINDSYDLEDFSEINKNENFAWWSEFVKINHVTYWVIGLVNTNYKTLQLEPILHRDGYTLKLMITKYIKWGNRIVFDGWVILSYLLIIMDMYILHIFILMDILNKEKSQQVILKVYDKI